MSPGRGRSIGEVLEELRDDFPDVSVSKIRFLEAQGLVTPQRTRSGYRQFSDEDVALLRWILFEQREHYLPLKVIRRRMKDGEGPGAEPAETVPQTVPAETVPPEPPTAPPGSTDLWEATGPEEVEEEAVAGESGLTPAALAELADFGLLSTTPAGRYGPGSSAAARAAAGFAGYGVEARHLRMYKTFAEREAALFSQVLAPMVRGGGSRESLSDLARLGGELRLVLLRVALGSPPVD